MEKAKTQTCEDPQELLEDVRTHLVLPDRAKFENEQEDLSEELGVFLTKAGYIKELRIKENEDDQEKDFTFDYDSESKIIYLSEEEIPLTHWRDNFFRIQTPLSKTEKHPFYPVHPLYTQEAEGDEIQKYMFLQKTVLAYQEYLKDKESEAEGIEPEQYYELALIGEVSLTPSVELFRTCYEKRELNSDYSRGLAISSSQENFEDEKTECIFKAKEDMNELITMYLWNPEFFKGFVDYLTKREKGPLGKKIIKISEGEAKEIKDIVFSYVEQMKEEIGYNK